jgi:hypothetical protein
LALPRGKAFALQGLARDNAVGCLDEYLNHLVLPEIINFNALDVAYGINAKSGR